MQVSNEAAIREHGTLVRSLRRRLENSERDVEVMRYEATTGESTRIEEDRQLAFGADVLAHWVSERHPRMPVEVTEAILLMRRQDVDEELYREPSC